jgi:alpha-L-fucosidase
MSISRRTVLRSISAAATVALVERAMGQDAPSIAGSTTAPATGPAVAVNHPIPPAPAPISAPAGFGVAPGPFQPTWDSLSHYQVPDWYRDAKLGIWAHWGPQCQPEMGDWYAQRMYQPGNSDYKFHVEHYGHPSKFGFKDVINTWKAQHWDPEALVARYKRAGAKFFAAMANHHDNFDMWDSTYQPWNAVAVGPKKNLIAGWERAARANGLKFAVSCHGDRAWSWYQDAQRSDPTGPLAGVPYDGIMTKAQGKGTWWEGLDPQDLYAQYHAPGRYNWQQSGRPPIDPAFAEKFFHRIVDLIDKHSPDLLYFDDAVLPIYPATDVGLRIAAYLYNTNLSKHGTLQAVMTGKGLDADQRKALVLDLERGVSDGREVLPWQTDTCIGSWHYERRLFDQHRYKSAGQVIQMLVDIVSKNGNLMLNIPVRGDGTIDDDEVKVLDGLTAWMDTNGEGIYATRPFHVYGEGPASATSQPRGQFAGVRDVRRYGPRDVRFTSKGDLVYAFIMGWPTDGKAVVESLAQDSPHYPGRIGRVELLGVDGPLKFDRNPAALTVTLPESKPGDHAHCLKITPA